MNDIKEEAKIKKLAAKKKSDGIIKIMSKADTEVTVCCLEALAQINDESASNTIARSLGHPDSTIRIAACKAAIALNTDYMKTHIQYMLSKETDEAVKKQMQELVNASRR